MKLKSGITDPNNHNVPYFNSVEFICRRGDHLYFIDTYRSEYRGSIMINSFGRDEHKCTDPAVEALPDYNPGLVEMSMEQIKNLVEEGKILPEAITAAMEAML